MFLRKHLLHLLCSLLHYLLMQENAQTNIKGKTLRSRRSQMFLKIAVLKNFAVLSRKHLHWSESLFNNIAGLRACIFVKKDAQRYFLCEYYKIFKNRYFYRTPPVYYTFPRFYMMIEFFGCLWV